MIPASYFFRDLYQRRFEADPSLGAEPGHRPRGGERRRDGLDLISAVVMGLAPGSATFLLGSGASRYGRRR